VAGFDSLCIYKLAIMVASHVITNAVWSLTLNLDVTSLELQYAQKVISEP